MEDIKIRKATKDDLDDLYMFEQGVIEAERQFDATLKMGKINYYDIEEMISASHIEIMVAEVKGMIIGSGYARIENAKPYLRHNSHAYLGFMYVHPAYRGKGINHKIIEGLKSWALSQNIKELRLEVYFENIAAIKAYEKSGFTKHMIEMRLGV